MALMPELPEVETMRRGILPIVGSRIVDVSRPRSSKKPITIAPTLPTLRRRAVGAKIRDVGRLGKRVVVHLDRGEALIFEPRMTGLVLLSDPPTAEHLRLQITLDGSQHHQLLYWDRRGLGSVRLLPSENLEQQWADRLGPDALKITAEQLAERLGQSRRAIKVALLDQRAVAGVGNLYASEILHLAKIHPARPCNELCPDEWKAIHAAMREVLRLAIRHEGSTLSDGTYRNALNLAGGYQNHHRVYDRAEERCLTCRRAEIQRVVQAQRSTFFCPACQPQRR